MSLINKVINDLEERQAFVANKDEKIFEGLTSADNPDHKNMLLTMNMFVLMLFLIASVSGTYALMGNRADKILQGTDIPKESYIDVAQILSSPKVFQGPMINSAGNAISSLDIERVKAQIQKNSLKLDFSLSSFDIEKSLLEVEEIFAAEQSIVSIRSIVLNERDNVILLNLELASKVNYKAYILRNPSRIVIEIDDAVLDGLLPDPGKLHGIKNVYLNDNHEGQFILTMDTTESYSIKEMELEPFSHGYALKISIVSNAALVSDLNKQFPEKKLETKKSVYSKYAEYGEIKKNISADRNVDFTRKMYIDAVELYRLEKQKEANELLAELLRIHADHKAARTLLAQKLISQGQLQQAEELLYEGLSTQKENTVWVDLYARLLVNKGDIDNAIDVLAGVTPDVNSEPDYFAFLAALYQKNEQHSEAIQIYREVLKVSPARGVWWMGLAISLESLQQNRDALYAYNRALQGDRMTQDLQKYVLGKIEYLNKRS